ncbi:hypothetical protein VTK73DRAFT_7248 [Phialemonium thermophilum]|uniref:SPT2 chromatin protein n=1 Tax=Phialemonium thermophilum TaxID=223376 RepID=A0ABR3XT03_9PEZI
MPISDLLASITGETPASSASPKPVSSAPKRKAEQDLSKSTTKALRPNAPVTPSSAQRNGQSVLVSRQPDKTPPITSSNSKASALSRTSGHAPTSSLGKDGDPRPPKKALVVSQNNGTGMVSQGTFARKPAPSENGPKPEPKKRSFAEIMARAKAAQVATPAFGVIQHKPVQKAMSKKEREQLKEEEARNGKATPRKDGASRPAIANGARHASATAADRRSQIEGESARNTRKTTAGGAKAAAFEEKKVKKAALATTGYTGTARPRPGSLPWKRGSSSAVDSTSHPRSREAPRYGGVLSGARRRYEDEEDDMDDFIEYDDEEPAYGYGGGYESVNEDESDMEAGLSDIDLEERRAELYARREDQEQEALEKRLKREKEERKRKMFETLRNKAR